MHQSSHCLAGPAVLLQADGPQHVRAVRGSSCACWTAVVCTASCCTALLAQRVSMQIYHRGCRSCAKSTNGFRIEMGIRPHPHLSFVSIAAAWCPTCRSCASGRASWRLTWRPASTPQTVSRCGYWLSHFFLVVCADGWGSGGTIHCCRRVLFCCRTLLHRCILAACRLPCRQ